MAKNGDTITINFRVDKKIVKIYDSIQTDSRANLMREVIERAVMIPEWIDSKILEHEGQITALKELRKISPLLQKREFLPEENIWFQQMYGACVNKSHHPSWLLNRQEGYNINFNTTLRQPEFERLLRKWLQENNLSMPKQKEAEQTESGTVGQGV